MSPKHTIQTQAKVSMQEMARLEQLTANPDFMPLLEDYAKDLADPKARWSVLTYPLLLAHTSSLCNACADLGGKGAIPPPA